MNTIKVTEEQAKIIARYTIPTFKEIDQLLHIKGRTDLSLVTIARIIEGESYEVVREFKVGDIVTDTTGVLWFVKEVTPKFTITCYQGEGRLFERDKANYTLLCKAENREDLKEATAE